MYEKYVELKNAAHVTDYQVSKATGISTATLSCWKQGLYTPKLDKLKAIADYFGVSIEYFFGSEKERVRNAEAKT